MFLLRRLGQYLHAVYESWVSLVSGVGSVVLLVLLAFWGDEWLWLKDNQKTFVWLAIIGLFVTGFVVWDKVRPDLTIEIQRVLLQPYAFWEDLETLSNVISIELFLVNTRSANTAVKRYGLTVHYDGQTIVGKGFASDGFMLESTHRRFIDLEAEKDKILPQGAPTRGLVCFVLEGTSLSKLRGKKMVLTVTDSYNVTKRIKATIPTEDTDKLAMSPPPYMNQLYKG